MALTLLLGGVRSGKSQLASELASRAEAPVVVIATAEGRDEEMSGRIARHRAERPRGWSTVEEPVDLCGAISSAREGSVVVVDCLTLWVSNLVESGLDDAAIVERAEEAAAAAADRRPLVVAVTNEVGSGVIPGSALGRRFTDVLGRVNAAWAAAADRSLLVVAGKVVPLGDAGALPDA